MYLHIYKVKSKNRFVMFLIKKQEKIKKGGRKDSNFIFQKQAHLCTI